MGYTVFVTATQLCFHSTKAARGGVDSGSLTPDVPRWKDYFAFLGVGRVYLQRGESRQNALTETGWWWLEEVLIQGFLFTLVNRKQDH